MMVKFIFSQKQEVKDLLWLYSEVSFFAKMPYKVYYPEISKDLVKALEKDPNDEQKIIELNKQFGTIFNREKDIYQTTLEKVEENWRKIEDSFFSFLKNNVDYKNSYKCFISRYGPGGTFHPLSSISVRARLENPKDINNANETIAHEIIHLCVNNLVKKYKLGFENTERLVDLILVKTELKKLFNHPTIQDFGDSKLDKIFAKNGFDIKKTVKEFTNT